MITHAQRVRYDRQGGVNRAAGDEKAAIDDVEIIHLMSPAIQVEHGRCRIFPESAGANLMTEAVHRHLRCEVTGLRSEVICLRYDMATAPDFLQDSLPSLDQVVEWL